MMDVKFMEEDANSHHEENKSKNSSGELDFEDFEQNDKGLSDKNIKESDMSMENDLECTDQKKPKKRNFSEIEESSNDLPDALFVPEGKITGEIRADFLQSANFGSASRTKANSNY